MVSTLTCCNKKTNCEGPSHPKSDSYSSDSHNSRARPTRPTARRYTSSCSPRTLETEMVFSSVDFIARGGQGGKLISYSQRPMETEMEDLGVDLNARHGQGCGQGENTTLGTPRAKETKIMDSTMDLTVENTILSTPRAMETGMVDSSENLISRPGQVTPSEMETKMEDSSMDLIETPGQSRERVGNKTVYLAGPLETKTVDSSGDLIAGTSCTTSRATEMELVDSGVDSIARQRQGDEQDDKTTSSISRAMETEMVGSSTDLMEGHKQVSDKGGNRTSRTQRATKNKMADTSVESIASRVHRRARNRTLYTLRAMETEMVESSVNLIARRGPGHEQGRNKSKRSARVMETGLMESDGDLTVGNTTLYTPRAVEAEMVQSSGDLIARTVRGHGRRGKGHRQGGQGGRRRTRRDMQGTWSHPTQKRARKGEQNKEISNPEPSSVMEKGPLLPKGQAANMRRGSPSPERVRSCKKTILSWLVDCEIIKEDEQVCYKNDTMKRAITGRITRGGILCSCCQRETSVWTFEKHAGSDLRQPYKHIYLPRKCQVLQDCQEDALQCAREQKCRPMFSYVPKETAADQNDDACSVCGDGGDLICCDKCPSTYHLACMNIERVPQNDWFCPYCVCKYCGLVVDLVVGKKECSEKNEGFKCSQCDKKCHWKCFEEFEKEFSKEILDLNLSRSYCGPGCREIYEKLEVSIGIRNDNLAKYSWRVIRLMDMTQDMTSEDVSAARNLHLESNSKVAVTWMLMNEAFETITDSHTGINVIQSIVYSIGSNLTRIDFSRFYMFVLEEDDEIIAAAAIRFHGRGIAEMPFIATEMAYRGQGVCQELMRVIESFVCNLKVKNLIIPSAPETSDMWKRKYNFTEVSEELKREISSYNILMFPGALRLYKDLSASIADAGDDIMTLKTIKLTLRMTCNHKLSRQRHCLT